MSKKEKENLSKVQTGMNSTSKLVLSSTSSTNERTEDDVGDDMDISLACDGCKKLIGGLNKLELLACGHYYCNNCFALFTKDNHSSCITATSPSSVFTREVSPQQIAEHDGELSQEGGAERVNSRGSNRPSRKALMNKSKSGRKRKPKKPDQQLWYFLHLTKPVVVSLATDATYGDLLSRLFIMLGIDKKTHDIHIRTQKSSSEEAEGEAASSTGEPAPLEVIDSKSRLRDLRIPRQKMLIIDVEEKKKQKSSEDKIDQKKPDKDKKSTHEDLQSLSQSRADEPKSS
ncbi:hypothetical protein CRE_25400 [Caenorhabditis remanei]|uniref:RING-type domain-containing protein n=2 Tax=Caenorhabditis remanei TaxID=31234 RepID=E3LSZ4_CAERE|nr:hypothetical protein CRE_25400 [Caenorhabditis remanei]